MHSKGKLIDRLGGVLTRPGQTLRAVAEEHHVAAAIGLILMTSLRPLLPGSSSADMLAESAPTGEWAVRLVLTGLFLLLVHGVARAYVGRGSFRGLVSAYGLAAFPKLLHYPLILVARTGAAQFAGLAAFAVSLWALALTVIAVRESYQLRTGAAIITCAVAAGTVILLLSLLAAGSLLLFGLALAA